MYSGYNRLHALQSACCVAGNNSGDRPMAKSMALIGHLRRDLGATKGKSRSKSRNGAHVPELNYDELKAPERERERARQRTTDRQTDGRTHTQAHESGRGTRTANARPKLMARLFWRAPLACVSGGLHEGRRQASAHREQQLFRSVRALLLAAAAQNQLISVSSSSCSLGWPARARQTHTSTGTMSTFGLRCEPLAVRLADHRRRARCAVRV